MRSVSNRLVRCRPLLGTFVEITARGDDADMNEVGIEAAFAAVARVHRLMSFHEADSDVSRLNRARPGEPIVVDGWTREVLATSIELQRITNGNFNISVASTLQRLGLLPCSVRHAPVPALPSPMEALELLPGNRISMRGPEGKIDLGGIAKGYAVDRAVEALRGCGVEGGLVNAGGDLAAFGAEHQTIAIRAPRDPGRSLCHVTIMEAALASSGPIFDPPALASPHCAVIDPKCCEPVRAVCAASVRAPCCLIADALTKVAMICGRNASAALDHFGASALLVMESGEVEVTTGWQGALSVAP